MNESIHPVENFGSKFAPRQRGRSLNRSYTLAINASKFVIDAGWEAMLLRPPALRYRLPFLRLSYLRDLCALLLLCGSFSSDSRKISAQKIARITKIWDPENCCF